MEIMYFPASFNELRRRLSQDFEPLWARVGYFMFNDHLRFIEEMNAELGVLVLPEMQIAESYEKYLQALDTYKPSSIMAPNNSIILS